jgi:hypothetical protein
MDFISASIVPFNYTSGIPQTSVIINTLGVFNYTDDLMGNCTANWVLCSDKQNILFNSYTLTQEEYNNWNSSPEGLLEIIANYLKVTISN